MRILFIYSDPQCGCTKKCCFELAKGIQKYEETTILLYDKLEESHILSHDIIVFQRLGGNGVRLPKEYCDKIFTLIHKYKCYKKFVYLLDDLVVKDQNCLPERFMRVCNAVICLNESLKKHLIKYNKNVKVIRTFVDVESLEKVPYESTEGFHIVCPSSGGLGIGMIKSIIPIIRKDFDIQFTCIGKNSDLFENMDGVTNYPIVPFEQLISILKPADILLNPAIPDDELKKILEYRSGETAETFLDCKSEIKYVLAGMTDTVIISSKTASYLYAVKNGVNGLLVEDSIDEWVDAVKLLCLNDELREKIIINAYEDVMKNYTLDFASQKIIKIFQTLYSIHLEDDS